jgi:UDP-glucose 4-epimerase
MIAAMRQGMGRRPGLIPVPPPLLKLALNAAGHEDWYERLALPLVVDTSALRRLGWTPRLPIREGLRRLVQA